MDAEAIAAREAEELMKERRELQARLKSQEKKVTCIQILYGCSIDRLARCNHKYVRTYVTHRSTI